MTGSAHAQVSQVPEVGDCDPGSAEAVLDVGNVRAKILNNGGQFWNGGRSVYEVPKGSGNNSIFILNLLVGGLVDGDLRVAASTYGPSEFWPGPIPSSGNPPSNCRHFDRIYTIEGEGAGLDGWLKRINGDWPVHLGAPYVERGGDPNSYNPADGDYPELLGDQMAWWIMNDLGNEHRRTSEQPLGIEVRGSAFAFGSVPGLRNHTFYRYRITNRSERPITSAYVGLYKDVDLGAAFDDYVGSDSSTGLAYFYNGDNNDEGSYGEAPPAVGFTVLRRPSSTVDVHSAACSYRDGRTRGLTNHLQVFGGGGVMGDASVGQDFYYWMQSRWRDGTPLREGGYGYESDGPERDFVYPGDPATGSFWSDMNSDDTGTANQPSDRKSVSGVGPFCLGPGDETEVVFAVLWARGDSNVDSVTKLKAIAEGMQNVSDDLLSPRRVLPPATLKPDFSVLGAILYPNPARSSVRIRLALPRDMSARLDVHDVLGRHITDITDGALTEGNHLFDVAVAAWPPGVYLVRIQLDHITETRLLVVGR